MTQGTRHSTAPLSSYLLILKITSLQKYSLPTFCPAMAIIKTGKSNN